MSFERNDIGIDLGTANTLVYQRGKGVILREPSVVAMDVNTGRIIAVGKQAAEMVGRTPGNIVAKRPLMDGVIASLEGTQDMMYHYMNEAMKRSKSKIGRVAICVPCGATEVERMAIRRSAESVGIKEPRLIEEPLAAAIGAGISCEDPRGRMVVDIGGGTTDVAVVSEGGIVASESIQVAGKTFDEDILNYLRKHHRVNIGERTAEEIKIKVGAAFPRPKALTMKARGIDIVSGWPSEVEIGSSEVMYAVADSIQKIAVVIKRVFERTPPELASDIKADGIMLAGGGSLLFGIERCFSELVGIRVFVADNPLDCVAIGTGMSFASYETKKKRGRRISRNKVADLYEGAESVGGYNYADTREYAVTEDDDETVVNKTPKEQRQQQTKVNGSKRSSNKEKGGLLDKLIKKVAEYAEEDNK